MGYASDTETMADRKNKLVFRQIVRDAEIAYAISPVVRRHRLSAEETKIVTIIPRHARARATHAAGGPDFSRPTRSAHDENKTSDDKNALG